MEGDSSIGKALLESRSYGSESRSLSFLFFGREKISCLYEKGGIDMFDFLVELFVILILWELLKLLIEKRKGEHKKNKNKNKKN